MLFRSDKTCSYCGSLHPEEVLLRIQEGNELIPTDKNYKAYIYLPSGQKKAYFQHFEERHKNQFIKLLNAGIVKIAFPDHFYVLPFFVQKG